MKTSEFLQRIQSIYGNYGEDGIQAKEIDSYISRETGEYRLMLYGKIRANISPKFKTPPDIADMEPYRKEIKEHLHTHAPLQIESGNGTVPPEDAKAFMKALQLSLASNKDPREDKDIQRINAKYRGRE